MDEDDEGANPVHLCGPAESEESQGGQVMDEHLSEIFSLHIRELCEEERPVESHLHHVVEPNLILCSEYNLLRHFVEEMLAPRVWLGYPYQHSNVFHTQGLSARAHRL